jgi:hypothetical protein
VPEDLLYKPRLGPVRKEGSSDLRIQSVNVHSMWGDLGLRVAARSKTCHRYLVTHVAEPGSEFENRFLCAANLDRREECVD